MVNGSGNAVGGPRTLGERKQRLALRLASILSGNYFYGPDRAGVNGDYIGQGCHGLINFAGLS